MTYDAVSPAATGLEEGLSRWKLHRWWRRAVVGKVDHQAVVARVLEESGWSPRYAFMTMMSAGIAVLGLLLSSPAVVIGAMLISPLMNPILGLGFSLATFDFREMRRSVICLAVGAFAAVIFTALIVLLSPLKAATPEILARTRPNLFDLLVALFAALAGTFAIIRGKGETIVGVAIATALMPPLAVVGYGLATSNLPVMGGALALFFTNLVTIALSATIVARYYGFGHSLSSHQSWAQTLLLLLVFVVMAVPLGVSLKRIASEALTITQVRSFLSSRFGPQSRITQLDVDFERDPIAVKSVVIAPRAAAVNTTSLHADLAKKLGRPITMQVDQVLLDARAGSLDRQRAEVDAAEQAKAAVRQDDEAGRLIAAVAGVDTAAVTLDSEHQRATVAGASLPDASLATYRVLEIRANAALPGWSIEIIPPQTAFPQIHFADNVDTLDATAKNAVLLSIWAAQRWNAQVLTVPGLPQGAASPHPLLAERRALAIAALLDAQKQASVPAAATGQNLYLGIPRP